MSDAGLTKNLRSMMTDEELLDYAGNLDRAGYAEDDIVAELARVMQGEPPAYYFANNISTGVITTDEIVIGPEYVKWASEGL